MTNSYFNPIESSQVITPFRYYSLHPSTKGQYEDDFKTFQDKHPECFFGENDLNLSLYSRKNPLE